MMDKRIDRLLGILDKEEIPYQLQVFEQPAHHASQAAELLNCPIGAVVKSLVLIHPDKESFLVVLVSGKNQLDFEKVARFTGVNVKMATPKEVIELTGFEVGAVPPFGVEGQTQTLIDQDLMVYDTVWGSAGSQTTLISLAPPNLKKLCEGQVVRIK